MPTTSDTYGSTTVSGNRLVKVKLFDFLGIDVGNENLDRCFVEVEHPTEDLRLLVGRDIYGRARDIWPTWHPWHLT